MRNVITYSFPVLLLRFKIGKPSMRIPPQTYLNKWPPNAEV